ncbi:hypothetical protein LCGC14_0365690 [marine sediment metagenome]|uniref:Uncharacterized protein n=1 Tax=marine sediment metagenome TaxID=412755 RepID=A0A0F9WF66_9ZZZZ
MSYRPEGWENPEPCSTCPNISRTTQCAIVCQTWQRYVLYEAGADAILTAIWELASESPIKTFTFDANIKQVYARVYDLPEEG